MAEIDLGFAEESSSVWLTNRYFPSKVGGKPAWLELDALPTSADLLCKKCQTPKAFLCQVYCPGDSEDSFHRMLYVFMCRTDKCQVANSAENFTVLRSQLGVNNGFYSQEPPDEDGEPLPPIPPKSRKLCFACGCIGPLSCARCMQASYCSAIHQRVHWSQHKPICTEAVADKGVTKIVDSLTALPEISFPEYEIIIQALDVVQDKSKIDSSDTTTDSECQSMEDFKKLESDDKTGVFKNIPDADIEQYAKSSKDIDDKHFRNFKKQIGENVYQIIRYSRGGSPLWIADVEKTLGSIKVPNCEGCGSKRQFEFQIMPQMLNLLHDERIDWGVLALYTCNKSCSPTKGKGYMNEFIIKQDIVHEKK